MKNIFCMETDAWDKPTGKHSIEPILNLLSQWPVKKAPRYLHRDVATPAEFFFYLKKWSQKNHSNYPILYLGFHGSKGHLATSDLRLEGSSISLKQIERRLEGLCKGRILYFGSCSTLDLNGNRLNSTLRKTGAAAICGYTKDVDWLRSTALDLLVLQEMQGNAFTLAGVRAVEGRVTKKYRNLVEELGFRMKYLPNGA